VLHPVVLKTGVVEHARVRHRDAAVEG